jgi:hypothetical protein
VRRSVHFELTRYFVCPKVRHREESVFPVVAGFQAVSMP